MVLRVVVPKNKDNLGTVSNAVTVRVTRRSSGGGGGGGGNDGVDGSAQQSTPSLPVVDENAPPPDDEDHRIKGRPTIKVEPAQPAAPALPAAPQCLMPGPYPVPCAPNESD
jgi:hypothetical protein